MKRQARIAAKRLSRLRNRQIPVLLEGLSEESDLLLQGRTEGQAPEIDGRVLINDSAEENPLAGQFYLTEVTGSLDYDLLGRIVGRC